MLDLTEPYETRGKTAFRYNNGNVEPHRGFGHVAMVCCCLMMIRPVRFPQRLCCFFPPLFSSFLHVVFALDEIYDANAPSPFHCAPAARVSANLLNLSADG